MIVRGIHLRVETALEVQLLNRRKHEKPRVLL